MRRTYFALIALAIVAFLLVSTLLARVFSADGAERSAVTSLIEAQARGDAAAMLSKLEDCRTAPRCRAVAAYDASVLRRPGSVSIIQLQPSTGFSLSSTTGYARVAWNAGGSLPIVQCVLVRRAGNAIKGIKIHLLRITQRLGGDASCPSLSDRSRR